MMVVRAFGMQHHAASDDDAAMCWRSVPPGHECDGPILLMALDPAFGAIKASGNVGFGDATKIKAKHLSEVQYHQAEAVGGIPITAPAHPGNANGARDEFGLCQHVVKLVSIKYHAAIPTATASTTTAAEMMIAVFGIRSTPNP